MAKVLFVWELGFGLGHIHPIKQYCHYLQGHDIYVAARSLEFAHILLEHNVCLLQAPHFQGVVAETIRSPLSFAHLLHNSGFESKDSLLGLVASWRTLYDLVEPDVVIFDHSPSALVAAKGYTFKKVLIGSGFLCPALTSPLGVFQKESTSEAQLSRVSIFESKKVRVINKVLSQSELEPIEKLSDIYSSVDSTLLTTYPELDHFPCRNRERYIGVPKPQSGREPKWPLGKGKKIFVYTHPFPLLEFLLKLLAESGQAVVFYSSSVALGVCEQFASSNICFESDSLSVERISNEADFAITNGNFNTAAQFALLGVPQVTIPLQMDQLIFSQRLNASKLANIADPGSANSISARFKEMLEYSESAKGAATAISSKYDFLKSDFQKEFTEAIYALL